MKLRRWSVTIAWMTAISMAACIALLVFNAGLLPVVEAYREVFSGKAFNAEVFPAVAPFLVLFLLVALTVASLILGWIFERKVMRPLEKAINFVESLSKSESIPALSLDENTNEEMDALLHALNVLRDRQQNLVARSHQNVAHQLKMTRERDRFEQLKQSTFGDILADARRSLGILRGQLLVQLDDGKEGDPAGQEFLRKAIRRQSALAREIEEIFDVNRLDWKRWNAPFSERFDTADFIHELQENARFLSRTRDVHLISRISSDVPGRLFADRELLMQLLGILLRTAGRAATPGSEIFFGCVRDERGEAVFDIRFVPVKSAGAKTMPDFDLEIVRFTAEIVGCAVEVLPDGENVVFRLSMPVGSSLFDAPVFTALPARPIFAGQSAELSGEKENLRILLLDDDDEGIEVLTRIMRRYALEIVAEKNEEAMLHHLQEESFAALVVTSPFADHVPEILLEKIGMHKRFPIVFISPKFPEAVRRQLEMHERVFWMTMPLNYELLDEVIRRVRHGAL